MVVVYKCKRINLGIAENIVRDRIKLSNNQDQYLLVDAIKIGYWPYDAREFMGKK